MGFNFSGQSEYTLNEGLIAEVINLYGISVKFLVTEKINDDDIIFGDYTHMKTDSTKIYEMNMLPENSEDWDTTDYSFNQYGMVNTENISLFVSRLDIDNINLTNEHVTGNLVVLPNNKIMEIVNAMFEVPGVNNLYAFPDTRTVLKLTCKPYDNKIIEELNTTDISVTPGVPYTTLEDYFNELIVQETAQDTEAEVTPEVPVVTKTGGIDTVTDKPIVDTTEQDVWGDWNN